MLTAVELMNRLVEVVAVDPDAKIYVYTGPTGTRVQAESTIIAQRAGARPGWSLLEAATVIPSAGGAAS